jgi:hypothetical protein
MYNAEDVNPGKWRDKVVLYDDGSYSAVWGYYENSRNKSLGVRWNGESEEDDGYPSQGGNPLWYVEPALVTEAILIQLRTIVAANEPSDEMWQYLLDIEGAIREFWESA